MNHARTTRRVAASLQDLAAARGHRCLTVLPSNASRERVLTLRMPGSWYARRHRNPDNVRAHYETTAPGIRHDADAAATTRAIAARSGLLGGSSAGAAGRG
ncbi:hypothetical protein [Streptomyces sp. NPDC047976]|uniref:hypothetical protein n=1 Tax=Streptomyces sp. NPDC047976 TaxID=3155746 RepID=UPI00342CFE29